MSSTSYPFFSVGLDHSSLEDPPNVLVDEMQKRTPNGSTLKQKMCYVLLITDVPFKDGAPLVMHSVV